MILCADFAETLAHAHGAADLVACSPPYCDARTYDDMEPWTDADYRRLGNAVFAALRPGGTAIINVDAPVREWRPGVGTERGLHPWRMLIDWTERIGFRAPDRLAFGRLGTPGAYRGRFRNDWEPLLWFEKPGGEAYFAKEAIASTAASAMTGKIAKARTASGELSARKVSGWAAENGMKQIGTLFDLSFVGAGNSGSAVLEAEGHPARWPLKLASMIVLCFSAPGALVVDPFVGAGTTGVAAITHGRRFLGGDVSQRWADVARNLVAQADTQIPMFGGARGCHGI